MTSEPLSITWPIRNEGRTDIWCRKRQKVELAGLGNGSYRVEVIRKNSMGIWQDMGTPTLSKPWTVGLGEPLRLSAPRFANSVFTFRFGVVAGQTYSVEYRDSLGASTNWLWLESLPPVSASGDYAVTNDASSSPARFYRIVTPAQP